MSLALAIVSLICGLPFFLLILTPVVYALNIEVLTVFLGAPWCGMLVVFPVTTGIGLLAGFVSLACRRHERRVKKVVSHKITLPLAVAGLILNVLTALTAIFIIHHLPSA